MRATIGVATLVAAMLLALPAQVLAQPTVGECQDRIAMVQADLDEISGAGRIGGNWPDRTYASLSSKLTGATTKLEQGKFVDALDKLGDFRASVITMRDAAKPKLSVEDAGLLLSGDGSSETDQGVDGAIECVGALG